MFDDANAWTHEVATKLGHENKQLAYHALRGVFHALRDRLPLQEAFDLAAQLPTLLRGVYFEGYRPAGKPEKYGRDGFLQRVNVELQKVDGESPERALDAVVSVLQQRVTTGEMDEVRHALPTDVQNLLP
jgi:uncharacterized protein (DUF2267 family)